MDSFTYLVAGVPDTDARELTRARPFAGGVSVRRSSLDLPGRHGTTPGAGAVVFDDGKLALTWELTADTFDAVEAERLGLMAMLGAPGDLIVTRRVGAVDQTAAHRLVSISDTDADSGTSMVTVTAVLSAPGVFWRGVEATSDPIAATAGTIAAEVPILAGCTAPVGDAVVRTTGPATGVTVRDLATGTGLSWVGTLALGAYVFMDAASLRAWTTTDPDAWAPSGTDVTSGLDYPTDGPLQLWPVMTGTDPTDRRVSVALGGSGRGATTAVTFRARPAYL